MTARECATQWLRAKDSAEISGYFGSADPRTKGADVGWLSTAGYQVVIDPKKRGAEPPEDDDE